MAPTAMAGTRARRTGGVAAATGRSREFAPARAPGFVRGPGPEPGAYRSDGGRASRPAGGLVPGARWRSSALRRSTSLTASYPADPGRGLSGALDFGLVSHPSLGLPPRDLSAGYPDAAAAVHAARARLAARALEVAVDADPTFRGRYSELALRELLSDTEALVDRMAVSLGSGEPTMVGTWADMLAPRYRKRGVPMDDVIGIAEGLRAAATTAIAPDAVPVLDEAIDAAVAVLRWHRRLGGDARRRNPVIAFIYKGA